MRTKKLVSFLFAFSLLDPSHGFASEAKAPQADASKISCAEDLDAKISEEATSDMQQAVLNYGRSASSFDTYEASSAYRWFPFEGKHGRGGIAYKEASFTRVIIGDPLLPMDDWVEAMKAFLAARPPFTATMATFASKEFTSVALETRGAAIETQTSVNLNPQTWETSGPKMAQIRKCIQRAKKLGFEVVEMKNQKVPEPWFKSAAQNLVLDWAQNSLKRDGNVHEVNLWDASEYKRYFALMNPETKEFYAMVVARPLPAAQGFYLWSARASNCPNGSLEATIAGAIQSMRADHVNYLTFGPFQEARPHKYIENSGGTLLSRLILEKLLPIVFKRAGYYKTMDYFKKFNFDYSEPIYNLIWPRKAWIRPYGALNSLFNQKQKPVEFEK